jgi:hypothetical protein
MQEAPPAVWSASQGGCEGGHRMRSEIILIGPLWAGKSTIAELLCQRLGLPRASMDDTSWRYYEEVGFDRARGTELERCGDHLALSRYVRPFLAHSVERHLADHPGCVIDFGAIHSIYDELEELNRVKRALAPYRNVILLLPSPDLKRSAAVLRERAADDVWLAKIREEHGLDLNEQYLRHPANRELARWVVYTEGRTPEETCEEIMQFVGR